MKINFLFVLLVLELSQCNQNKKDVGDSRHYQRIIVSTDIGGTDFDDYQSMVHLLLYADTFDIEGIISSPFGDGRKSHILEAIDAYEKDYNKLKTFSERYPTADSLRKITKQGAILDPGPVGFSESTEGSDWIIKCARREDTRPLNILVWGGIEDLAQALHDAPDILPKLRVYFVGGPNKKWSVNAYQYVADNFKDLWIIESNSTYRGWFVGGDQSAELSNSGFVEKYVKNCGALGEYFFSKGKEMKMGDTPSLIYFLHGNVDDPSKPGWGGQYVRAWERPFKVFNRITTDNDSIEEFGVVKLILPYETDTVKNPFATMHIDREIKGLVENDCVIFLFSPKLATKWDYSITSNIPDINNLSGKLISFKTPASNKLNPSSGYPNWWTDDPSKENMEDGHIGIKTVNRWREEFLMDFARRMNRIANKN